METKTLIIGGGLAGVSSLYELTSRGEQALLLEAGSAIAGETSFANGGMLTPSQADPWNSPGVGRLLLASLADPHSAMKIRLRALPGLIPWGLAFLRHSAPARHKAAMLANYALARLSVERTRALTADLGLRYGQSDLGTLKIFDAGPAADATIQRARSLADQGLQIDVLTRQQVLDKEPMLSQARTSIAGGLYFPQDGTGDAHAFTQALAEKAVQAGGEIRLNSPVVGIVAQQGRVKGVTLASGEGLTADRVVVAAASASASLVKRLGVRLPVKPAKGYSLTFDMTGHNARPGLPVIDDSLHACAVPLGDRLRLVGTAEFAGQDRQLRPERLDMLSGLLSRLYPDLATKLNTDTAQPWCGLRPMSADGRPFIGPAGPEGLWINTGQGHLGWTMASGSAKLMVDLMHGHRPSVDPMPFRADRGYHG